MMCELTDSQKRCMDNFRANVEAVPNALKAKDAKIADLKQQLLIAKDMLADKDRELEQCREALEGMVAHAETYGCTGSSDKYYVVAKQALKPEHESSEQESKPDFNDLSKSQQKRIVEQVRGEQEGGAE